MLTILMKPGFWARIKMFFLKKKICWILLDFSTKFPTKIIGPLYGPSVPDGCKNDISVPYGCTYGVRLFYEIKLLIKENILDTQIIKKFHV